MTKVLDSHFHCPACGPLVFGQTRAICGRIIPSPVVGNGPERKCPDCKANRRTHKKERH
jgi:rubredoxin